jgi:CRP-like cAMP-binding protein
MNFRLPVVGPLERALHLRSFRELRNQSPQDLVLLAQLLREQWVRRGTELLAKGRRVPALHFLVEGRAGREQDGSVVRRVATPEAVGLLELLSGAESRTRYVAETNLLVLEADAAEFIDLLEENGSVVSGLRLALGRQIFDRQRELGVAALEPRDAAASGPPLGASFGLVERLIWTSRSPVLAGFGVGVLADLVRDEREVHLRQGEILWKAESEGSSLALVVDGTMSIRDRSGGSVRIGAGSVVGAEAVFGGAPHAYTATVETPAVIIRIDAQALLDAAEDHFEVASQMLAFSARTLLGLRDRCPAAARDDFPARGVS